MKSNEDAIIPMTPTADHSDELGCFVKDSSGSSALCAAATDIPVGPIVQGEDTDGRDSVAVCGGVAGVVRVKAGGACTAFSFGTLSSAGKTVVDDPGTGARVRVCRFLESGVAGDRLRAVLMHPFVLS